jgi:chorismate mutase
MPVRGIRGAIDAARNTRKEILGRTRTLLEAILRNNRFRTGQIAAAIFSLTPDLDAEFPAIAARELGWMEVPLMCCRELAVPGGMKRVIRVLLLVNTSLPASRLRHQYLGRTPSLRPDLNRKTSEGART